MYENGALSIFNSFRNSCWWLRCVLWNAGNTINWIWNGIYGTSVIIVERLWLQLCYIKLMLLNDSRISVITPIAGIRSQWIIRWTIRPYIGRRRELRLIRPVWGKVWGITAVRKAVFLVLVSKRNHAFGWWRLSLAVLCIIAGAVRNEWRRRPRITIIWFSDNTLDLMENTQFSDKMIRCLKIALKTYMNCKCNNQCQNIRV